MAKSLSRYTQNTCYHGYAGIASAFAALGHNKLKPGGVIALVLPLSAASGQSWLRFREMIAGAYTGITILSLAAADNDDLSFSADTGMAECLVIARKLVPHESHHGRALFAIASAQATGIRPCKNSGRRGDRQQAFQKHRRRPLWRNAADDRDGVCWRSHSRAL